MNITSPAFTHNESLPGKYTCDSEGINPPLKISGVPQNAKSLVLILDDPDAPAGTYTHWTVWNIDPKTEEIQENSVPKGAIEGITSSGETGYRPPCPPSGAHRYTFKLYALDTTLDLDSSAKVQDIESAMKDRILESSELIGIYSRQ
jgi:hypothetical protein